MSGQVQDAARDDRGAGPVVFQRAPDRVEDVSSLAVAPLVLELAKEMHLRGLPGPILLDQISVRPLHDDHEIRLSQKTGTQSAGAVS